MALTRNMLKAMGLNDEQVSSVIEAHVETMDAVKKERDTYKSRAESVDTLTRERDEYKQKAEKAGDSAKVQAEFDAYKAKVEKAELNGKKARALDVAFKDAGVQRDSFRNSMIKAWDMDSVELDEKGAIKDMDGLKAAVNKDYADFIATEKSNPLPKNDPPAGGNQRYTREDIAKMTPEQINANWDKGIKQSLGQM